MLTTEQKTGFIDLARLLGQRAVEHLPTFRDAARRAAGREPTAAEIQASAETVLRERFAAIYAAIIAEGGSPDDAADIISVIHDSIRDGVIGLRH